MLKIYLCEDNEKQRKNFTKIIKDIIDIKNYDMEICTITDNPYEILDNLKYSINTGIYFLDIDLHSNINGIQLAEKIREHDPRGFIIFVTTHAEMSYLTFLYKVEAMDYIIKDNYSNIKQRFVSCIENALEKYTLNISQEPTQIFSTKVNDKIININYRDILFFETSPTIHKIIVHCFNRQIEFYGQMKSLNDLLDDRFYRCHNSFIVNKDNIKEIDKKNRIAYMINGEECFISTRGLKNLI